MNFETDLIIKIHNTKVREKEIKTDKTKADKRSQIVIKGQNLPTKSENTRYFLYFAAEN